MKRTIFLVIAIGAASVAFGMYTTDPSSATPSPPSQSPAAPPQKKLDSVDKIAPSTASGNSVYRVDPSELNGMCQILADLKQLGASGEILSKPTGTEPFGPAPCKDWLDARKAQGVISPF